MFARVALRTPRIRGIITSPAILSQVQSRTYVRSSILFQDSPASASKSGDRSQGREYSEEQPEFEGSNDGDKNTTPSSQTPAGIPRAQTGPASSSADYSSLQEEFRTRSQPEANTAPQDTSPPAADAAVASAQEEQPAMPLHDLTKGIPSTLDAELEQAQASRRGEKSDVARASSGGRGDRQTPASDFTTSVERRRTKIMRYFFGLLGLSAGGWVLYFGRDWDTEEEERLHPNAPSGWSASGFYNRVKARFSNTMDYYNEPAFPKLLPDPDPAWERPYTLVLSLEDLLVHQEWTREHGWRIAKRPGVDYFLRYLSQYYELVIFTSIPSMTADPIIRKLDPYRIVLWPLFREATRYSNGEYIKDLSFLNRDLTKTILIDTVPSHAARQPENAIILPKWTGSPGDKSLVGLVPFLEHIAAVGINDTRTVLSSFAGKDIPTEFAAREAQARARFNAQLSEQKAKRPKRSIGDLGSLLGIRGEAGTSPDGFESLSEGLEKGKMLHDQIRERGQRAYEDLDKQIRENGDKWLKEMAADEEKAREEYMKGMKSGLTSWFAPGRPEMGGAGRRGG